MNDIAALDGTLDRTIPPGRLSFVELAMDVQVRPKRCGSTMPMADRFWSKVAMGSPAACWPWLAFKARDGYGRFNLPNNGPPRLAHRIAYELVRGRIPEGFFVCHHCDNPPCCNPAHLFVGTNIDNVRDRDRKGRLRNVRGSMVGTAKLTEQDVIEIRSAPMWRGRYRELAARFGVSIRTIQEVRLRNPRNWRWVEQ